MPRLLLLSNDFPPFHGGIATYSDAIAHAASALGHEVVVIAPESPQQAGNNAGRPFEVVRVPFKRNRHLAYHARIAIKFVRRFRPDILHAPDFGYIPTLFAVSRYMSGSVLATIHGSELLRIRRPQWFGRALLRGVLCWPDLIAVNSDFTRRLVLERHPEIDPHRVITTHLGVDPYWFEQDNADPDVRSQLGLKADDRIVLTVARLDPRKGHRSVLRALALLPREVVRTIVYVIVGDGDNSDYKRELDRLAAQSPARIVFTGPISRPTVRALYREASVFCMPGEPNSRCVEGFGLAYLEAAAQSVPSIATALGGAPEVVVNGETGTVTAPLDDQEIALAIAKCITDRAFRERTGRAALARARAYTWERCALETYGPATPAGTTPSDWTTARRESTATSCSKQLTYESSL